MSDLEQRLDAICETMESAQTGFNEATQCVVTALTGVHERLENIEKWIKNQESKGNP